MAELSLPRCAILTAVLPAPPLPLDKAIRTDALFHGQHILPRDCASICPPEPSRHQSPTSPLNLHGGRIISIRPMYFVSTALSHISRRLAASAMACFRDWKPVSLLRGSAAFKKDGTLKDSTLTVLQHLSQNRRRSIRC